MGEWKDRRVVGEWEKKEACGLGGKTGQLWLSTQDRKVVGKYERQENCG